MFNEDEALIAAHGGKLGFSRWTNANMIVSAQIESRLGHDNLDAILAVPGLGVIAGGPNDFCASLGHPGEPDHPERQRLTADIERRARAAGKRVTTDIASTLNLPEWLLGSARAFARQHTNDPLGT
jgi:2-keto-3-deoxy-L-rhamnonate aldolase RhmA